MSDPFEVLPTPIKSESDRKEYRVIKLKNELVACLISDPTQISQNNDIPQQRENETDVNNKNGIDEKKAMAMLCINVGHYSNPKHDIQGLANLLEHMVIMGSEKYPTENDFSSFIRKRGGTYDAFTREERTCFYFDCLEKHFSEALDKFAQFFIGPLLKKETMTRARKAVNSGCQWGKDAVKKKQLFLGLAKDDCPINSFGSGNLKTLKDDIDDDKLHQAVNEFRKRHYSANRMVLAVQSRLPMDDLQNLVLECYSDVPNNHLPKDDFNDSSNEVYNMEKFNRIYYIKPIDEEIEVTLSWGLPSFYEKYRTKSLKYIRHILGHEGTGSVLSYLKKHVWATDLSSDHTDDTIASTFNCCIYLTKEGFKHLNDVIETVFSYIKLMRISGPQEYLFEDIKAIEDIDFKYDTENQARNTVLNLGESMHRYPSEHFLTGSKLYYEFDPDEITTIVDQLTPSKVNIMILNKDFPNGLKFDKTKKWFKTEYTDIDIPEDLKLKWESVDPYPELQIPPPNQYITENFTLLPEEPDHPEYPQKLIDTDKYELWYRKDQNFKIPLGEYCFDLISPIISPIFNESAKKAVLAELLTILFSYFLDEEAYPARLAKLSYSSVRFTHTGFSINVSGYNEKLPILIDVIVKLLGNLDNYITEEIFLGIKEQEMKNNYDFIRNPACLSINCLYRLLMKQRWYDRENYNELLELTYEDMQQYIQDYKKELYVKCLVQGNISLEVACDTVKKFVDALQFEPLPEDKYPRYVVAQIPLGDKCLYVESNDKEDSSSLIKNYYQIGPISIRDTVILDLIMLILEEPLFDILKSKEVLASYVDCDSCVVRGILGYTFEVTSQAHKFSTEYVDSRIEAFIKHSQKILEDEKEEDFQHVKDDYIKNKEGVDLQESADRQLSKEVYRNWCEINEDDYVFDRVRQEVKIAKDITLDKIRLWWEKHNHFGSQENYRKISIQIKGHVQEKDNPNEETNNKVEDDKLYRKPISIIYLGNREENKKDDPEYFIEDIDAFRDNLENYPPKPIKKGP